MKDKLSAKDYPIAETRPEQVLGRRKKPLDSLTLEAVIDGEVEIEDFRITPQALLQQAEIARSVGRAALASNLERASEMTKIHQSEVMEVYELLRPGRAQSQKELLDVAQRIRSRYEAVLLAEFIQEAADFYHKRGLFRKRY